MTGGEWSSLSNYRSCCEVVEAKVLLGFSQNRIFTRVTQVCAFLAMFLHVCVQLSVLQFVTGDMKPVASHALLHTQSLTNRRSGLTKLVKS